MRKVVSWALYWLGDAVSKWNDHDARFTRAGFWLYQRLMLLSDRVQGDGDGPWINAPTQP